MGRVEGSFGTRNGRATGQSTPGIPIDLPCLSEGMRLARPLPTGKGRDGKCFFFPQGDYTKGISIRSFRSPPQARAYFRRVAIEGECFLFPRFASILANAD